MMKAVILLAAVAIAIGDQVMDDFVERNQHLIPAETQERLYRERRADNRLI